MLEDGGLRGTKATHISASEILGDLPLSGKKKNI